MEFMTGFESTYIPQHDVDVVTLTGHDERYADDLRLVKDAGVRRLRYPALWHQVEREPGRFDWAWTDATMAELRDLGLDPIVDLVHHTSFPGWIKEGMADPDFPRLHARWGAAFAERYPWVRRYTIFNEPFATTLFCGNTGTWYPFYTGKEHFYAMIVNVARSIRAATDAVLRVRPDAIIIHVDTCEGHAAVGCESSGDLLPDTDTMNHTPGPDIETRYREGLSVEETDCLTFVRYLNDRRFVFLDLLLGRVDAAHPLFALLTRYAGREVVEDFREYPAHIDLLGLDYYAHSEYQFAPSGPICPSHAPVGFAALAREYHARYSLPFALTETNIRGFVSDRASWLKHMVEQCEELEREGLPFHGFAWFPFIDSTDWDSLLRDPRQNVDPVGIYWLDAERFDRHESILSEVFAGLARGRITGVDLPAFALMEPVSEHLAGYRRFMDHWDWEPPRHLPPWAPRNSSWPCLQV